MFEQNQPQHLDEVELQKDDRVAAMDDAGKMRKARVDTFDAGLGMVGVTFHKGDTVHLRERASVLPLYRYATPPSEGPAIPLVLLPAAPQ